MNVQFKLYKCTSIMEITKKETEEFYKNHQNKSDFEFVFKINRWLLQPIGLWPLGLKNSKIEKFMSIISIIYCIFFLLFLTVPGCLEMLLIKDLGTGLEKIGPLSFNITNTINYCLFLIHKNEVSVCLETMFHDWRDVKNQKDRTVMMKNIKKARYFIVMCGIFMFCGGLPFCTILPILENSASSDNLTVKNLAFSGYFVIFDYQVQPFYDIVFFLQFLSTLATCSLTCGICSITILFVMHICGQLQIVMSLLNNLVDECNNKKCQYTNDKMALIVQQHLRSLRFAARVEKIMQQILLVEFLSSTFGICLIGYYIIIEFESRDMIRLINYCALFSSYIFNIFIYCYISELLLAECEKVGKVAYKIDWNCLPEKRARDIILIILISSRPSKLTGGKMIPFSIETFCSVIKASAAYLNLIRSAIK